MARNLRHVGGYWWLIYSVVVLTCIQSYAGVEEKQELNRRASALVLRPSALVCTFPASSCIIGHCLSLIGYSVGFCFFLRREGVRQGYFWGYIRLAYIWDLNGEAAIKMQVSSRRMTSRLITYTSRFVVYLERRRSVRFSWFSGKETATPRSAPNRFSSSDELSAHLHERLQAEHMRLNINEIHAH
jgi:hypothetical protein